MMIDPPLAPGAACAFTFIASIKRRNLPSAAAILCMSLYLLVAPVHAETGEWAALDANSLLTTVQRNHGEAGTLLDSMRGDVYQAVLLGTRGETEHIRQVQKVFAEHARNLKVRIEANRNIAMDQNLRSNLKALEQKLQIYVRSANEVIAVAGDQEKAVPKLDGFQEAFDAFENAMGRFGELIDAQASQRKQAVAQRFSPAAVLGMALLGLALLSIFGFAVHRGKARTRDAEDNPRAGSSGLAT